VPQCMCQCRMCSGDACSTRGRAERSSVRNQVGHAVYSTACMVSYTCMTPATWWASAGCGVCQAWPGLLCYFWP
jgi:hypothetical protein